MKLDKKSRALRKFLRFFKKGFYDPKYLAWERDYKWNAHLAWEEHLNEKKFSGLMEQERYSDIAGMATRIESRTNLLFSFEKMALRDAVKEDIGAEVFANALYNYVYGHKSLPERFDRYVQAIGTLPRKQTRVLTWPLVTVFGFIANPKEHIFLKPVVTKNAAEAYGFDFEYRSRPNWDTYFSLLEFANKIRKDHKSLKPRDYIDLQSFIWILGSPEYE